MAFDGQELGQSRSLRTDRGANNEQFLIILDHRITEIARSVIEATLNSVASFENDSSLELRRQLSLIKAKEYISVREASLLLSCSDSHVRKLIRMARTRKTSNPIPFVDLHGVTVLPLEALLSWANPTSPAEGLR
jgi:hypothetical protein